MEYFFLYFLVTLAIERFVEITVNADLKWLEWLRQKWMKLLPRLSTLAECKYCQSFWASLAVAVLMPFPLVQNAFLCFWAGYVAKSLLLWMSLWGGALIWDEFLDRYLNRAPTHLAITELKADQESDS